jgi:hypothetical protein
MYFRREALFVVVQTGLSNWATFVQEVVATASSTATGTKIPLLYVFVTLIPPVTIHWILPYQILQDGFPFPLPIFFWATQALHPGPYYFLLY